MKKVRVRFAPSPTGGLHLGGVRTALYNYLFARQHNGDFILRIEDTDQSRYVPGAEAYIMQCLDWCGLHPDESPQKEGAFGPYRQSERRNLYTGYARQLIESGHAYYAFDTPEELEQMRTRLRTPENPSPQYDHKTRMQMRNALTLPEEETRALLQSGTPHVIRIMIPEKQTVTITDMIRGTVHFDTDTVDDKVLLKADGMPTYHLAVVVDDYLMQISHVFRGEEWLPGAPVHALLWECLGWKDQMPQWAHLPLILKPDGNGKLSKRDGERLGFPVFAINWTDPGTGISTDGFKEKGFLPEAFINMLAMLGWNNGTEQEVFSPEALVKEFSVKRIHKAGAKFDYEKARWFNYQHIQQRTDEELAPLVAPFFQAVDIKTDEAYLIRVIGMIKERCHLLADFREQGIFFFMPPENPDINAIKQKWTAVAQSFFKDWIMASEHADNWQEETVGAIFQDCLQRHGLKKGDAMLMLRIMLVGEKFGPGVFQIASMIGKVDTRQRVEKVINLLRESGVNS